MAGKRMYGLNWPEGLSQVFIELQCWKKWREAPFNTARLLEPEEHFFNATKLLFTPAQYTPDPWSRRMVRAWTRYDLVVAWGAASCGKSQTFGLLALLDYLADINDTMCILASTSKPMLAVRSFAAVRQYFRIVKNTPGYSLPVKDAKSFMAICNEDTDDSSEDSDLSVKAGIRGVAVSEGTEEQSRTRLQGAHMGGGYMRMIGDESEGLRDSFFAARSNASVGAKNFKLVLLCNPASMLSKTAYFAEPKSGWASVSIEDDQWETAVGGICLHFDGFKSPAITEPDGPAKYPYLITRDQIDRIVAEAHGNMDSPEIYQMVRGWPPPAGMSRALLTEQELVAFGARDPVVWANDSSPVRLAALDPAFTADGDACVLQTATLGRDSLGRAALALDEPEYIPILASSARPVTYQISDAVRLALSSRGIPLDCLAVDDSGTQSVADVLDVELGAGCVRYNYGNKPSERALSAINPAPASERCKNLITELYMLGAEFVRSRQLRGLGDKAAQHWTQRRFKRDGVVGRILETKREYKKRTGLRSPDEGDAAAMVCALARDKFGFLPGGVPASVAGVSAPSMYGVFRSFIPRTKYVAQTGVGRLSSYLKPK